MQTAIHLHQAQPTYQTDDYPPKGGHAPSFVCITITDRFDGGALKIFLDEPADANTLIAAVTAARLLLVEHENTREHVPVREGDSAHVGDTGHDYSAFDQSPEAMATAQENLK